MLNLEQEQSEFGDEIEFKKARLMVCIKAKKEHGTVEKTILLKREKKVLSPFSPPNDNTGTFFILFCQSTKVRFPAKPRSIAYRVSFADYYVLNCDVLISRQLYHDRIDQRELLLIATIILIKSRILVTDKPAYAPL